MKKLLSNNPVHWRYPSKVLWGMWLSAETQCTLDYRLRLLQGARTIIISSSWHLELIWCCCYGEWLKKKLGKKATEPVHGIKGLPAVQLDGFLKELWFQFLNMLSLCSEPLGLEAFLNVVFMLGAVPHTQWHICWVISSPCFERGKTRQSVARPAACLPRGLLTHCKFVLRAVGTVSCHCWVNCSQVSLYYTSLTHVVYL